MRIRLLSKFGYDAEMWVVSCQCWVLKDVTSNVAKQSVLQLALAADGIKNEIHRAKSWKLPSSVMQISGFLYCFFFKNNVQQM